MHIYRRLLKQTSKTIPSKPFKSFLFIFYSINRHLSKLPLSSTKGIVQQWLHLLQNIVSQQRQKQKQFKQLQEKYKGKDDKKLKPLYLADVCNIGYRGFVYNSQREETQWLMPLFMKVQMQYLMHQGKKLPVNQGKKGFLVFPVTKNYKYGKWRKDLAQKLQVVNVHDIEDGIQVKIPVLQKAKEDSNDEGDD